MVPANINLLNQILYAFFRALSMLCSVFGWVLVIHAILSWFVSPFNKVYQFLGRATGPLRAPFLPLTNKLIRKGLPLDLSGLCAMVALNIISGLCDWAASAVLFM